MPGKGDRRLNPTDEVTALAMVKAEDTVTRDLQGAEETAVTSVASVETAVTSLVGVETAVTVAGGVEGFLRAVKGTDELTFIDGVDVEETTPRTVLKPEEAAALRRPVVARAAAPAIAKKEPRDLPPRLPPPPAVPSKVAVMSSTVREPVGDDLLELNESASQSTGPAPQEESGDFTIVGPSAEAVEVPELARRMARLSAASLEASPAASATVGSSPPFEAPTVVDRRAKASSAPPLAAPPAPVIEAGGLAASLSEEPEATHEPAIAAELDVDDDIAFSANLQRSRKRRRVVAGAVAVTLGASLLAVLWPRGSASKDTAGRPASAGSPTVASAAEPAKSSTAVPATAEDPFESFAKEHASAVSETATKLSSESEPTRALAPDSERKAEPAASPEAEPEAAAPSPRRLPAGGPEEDGARSERHLTRASAPKRDREAAKLHYQEGTKLFVQGQLEKAEAEFQKALAADSSYTLVFRGLGLVHERSGNRSKAISAFRRYLRGSPNAKDRDAIRQRISKLGN